MISTVKPSVGTLQWFSNKMSQESKITLPGLTTKQFNSNYDAQSFMIEKAKRTYQHMTDVNEKESSIRNTVQQWVKFYGVELNKD